MINGPIIGTSVIIATSQVKAPESNAKINAIPAITYSSTLNFNPTQTRKIIIKVTGSMTFQLVSFFAFSSSLTLIFLFNLGLIEATFVSVLGGFFNA